VQRALSVTTTSPEETLIIGAALAPVLLPGDVISLSGDLGAGKTVFVQGLAASLGVQGRVTSPTFTIVHQYEARFPIVHVDVYRLDSFQDLLDIGFEDFLDPAAIVLLEWGEAVEQLLPRAHLKLDIHRSDDPDRPDDRRLVFRPRGEDWVRKVFAMRDTAETLLDAASSDESPGERFEVVAPEREPRNRSRGEPG
jgi:tRNA threonylcarbamoyladenosine biosynthesis protein TsaE